jgi:hypothetical protein
MEILPMRALLLLSALLLPPLGLQAGEEPNPARGLAIYKPSAFRPDSSAALMEYVGLKNFPAATVFVTPKGRRLTVPDGKAEVLFLPYPGKGEATPDQAFALLEIARGRFPQFEIHYRAYEHVWREEAKRPPAQIQAEIARRASNEKSAGDFASWVKSLFPQREPPKLPQNPLGPTALNPAPTPTPQPAPAPEESKPDPEPSDPADTLRKLQEFYRLSGQSEN